MNWDALAALSEFIGAISVVVTLIYLSMQIRQNTRAIRLGTNHAVSEEFRGMFALIAEHGELAELVQKAATDATSIVGADKARYYGKNSNFIHAMENAYFQSAEGALDPRHWAGMHRMLIDYTQVAGFIEYWANRKHWFSDDFQQFMDADILQSKTNRNVPVPGQF